VTDASGSIALDTSVVGIKNISVAVGDKAGNQTGKTASYSIIYGFKGLLGPYSPAKINKAGSSIPLKWHIPMLQARW
jgi:hypothetical protein